MKSGYTLGRALWKYLGGTALSRAGDEMTGPALLLAGFAVTGRPAVGSALLAAGAALAGPLAGRSVAACLFVAAGLELCAAAAYLLIGPPPQAARPAPRRATRTGPQAGTTVRSEERLL